MKKIYFINQIIQKYNPNKNRCRPTVNLEISAIENRDNLEIACLITGYKHIYFTNFSSDLKELDPILKYFLKEKKIKSIFYKLYQLSKPVIIDNQTIMILEFIEKEKTILYTKYGKKNALLMQLKDLELNLEEFNSPGSWAESNNPYLTGILLKYSKTDIKTYYQIDAFRQSLKNPYTLQFTLDNTYINWPQSLKNLFLDFLKTKWRKTENFILYKRDKQEANYWLNKYTNLTLSKIKNIIKKYNLKLNKLIKLYNKN